MAQGNYIEDIYESGIYVQNNPSLHEEDADHKFSRIRDLLDSCEFNNSPVRILDVGGGAGSLARLVCDYLVGQGYETSCDAYDRSEEMLAAQLRNNTYINLGTSDFTKIQCKTYDLVLLIDVVEHVRDNSQLVQELDAITKYCIYNIPTERNLLDWMRNIYMRNQYYSSQTESLGHVHFYSYFGAKKFIREHHILIKAFFSDYAGYLLGSSYPDYVTQRSGRLRKLELVVSDFIYRRLRLLAPSLIQGSVFALAKSRKFF